MLLCVDVKEEIMAHQLIKINLYATKYRSSFNNTLWLQSGEEFAGERKKKLPRNRANQYNLVR